MFKDLDNKCWVVGWIEFGVCIVAAIALAAMYFGDEFTQGGLIALIAGFFVAWFAAMPFFALSQLLERTEKMDEMKSEIALLSKWLSMVIGEQDSAKEE